MLEQTVVTSYKRPRKIFQGTGTSYKKLGKSWEDNWESILEETRNCKGLRCKWNWERNNSSVPITTLFHDPL